ncbi:hypothetical protein [Bradyrhizobium lablabi]|uniref:hypothetical protein n=1 Tax=Bradyrhizobium lablabi TaxID=722472 RepID=UPI0012E36657|nr:hypothetical protein [Bradyrhizobium lablabi]
MRQIVNPRGAKTAACACDLKECCQLIEPVKDFQPDENQGCDHQIIAKMHAEIETNAFRGLREFYAKP